MLMINVISQVTQLSHIEIFRRFLNIKDSEAQKWFKNALAFCSDKNKKSINCCRFICSPKKP